MSRIFASGSTSPSSSATTSVSSAGRRGKPQRPLVKPQLELEIGLGILGNLADEWLEGQLPNQELCQLLVPTDLSQSNCTGAEPVRLLHTTSCLQTVRKQST